MSKLDPAKDNDDLLNGLTALGCGVKKADGTTYISLPDDFAEFILDRPGEWLYLGTTFLTPEEIDASAYAASLDRFLLELQDRNLGCHFAYSKNGFLTIGAELYQPEMSAKELLQVMDQIAFVIESCIPICDQILEDGRIPADNEIDLAFGAGEKLH